jgi:hypothetical protein
MGSPAWRRAFLRLPATLPWMSVTGQEQKLPTRFGSATALLGSVFVIGYSARSLFLHHFGRYEAPLFFLLLCALGLYGTWLSSESLFYPTKVATKIAKGSPHSRIVFRNIGRSMLMFGLLLLGLSILKGYLAADMSSHEILRDARLMGIELWMLSILLLERAGPERFSIGPPKKCIA